MSEKLFFCHHCNDFFSPRKGGNATEIQATRCPCCHGNDYVALNDITSDRACSEIGPPPWEFVCFQCQIYFEIPSPSTPEQGRNIKCPVCQGVDIKQFHVFSLDTMDQTCFG